jgi:hypothetical protein
MHAGSVTCLSVSITREAPLSGVHNYGYYYY